MKESILYYSIKFFAFIIRRIALRIALFIGRVIGVIVYYFDIKHKSQVYANLKTAFAGSKSPNEIKFITKQLFKNYGQNIIEFLRLPLMDPKMFRQLVEIEGEENISRSLEKKKGLILLAMHFGSWEVASLSCGMLGHPYKVIVKPQEKYSKLDELLNSYRSCGGSIVLSRGLGTRDFVKSLKNNEIIGMVADQGGRDGVLVPFFGKEASMSVGAIKMGLKWDVPICFSVVVRQKNGRHKMFINKPLELINTGDQEKDIVENLKLVTKLMEGYIMNYPSEFMWFYKIWKYSKQSNIVVLNDNKTGHLRQSQLVAKMIQKALSERNIESSIKTAEMTFKNKFMYRAFSLLSFVSHPFLSQGRLEFLKWFLAKGSFSNLCSIKADFIVSCGSSLSGLNYLISQDTNAKSIVVQRPGILGYNKFDLVILPQHDIKKNLKQKENIAVTHAAPNLITPEYIELQKEGLLSRFSHLKTNFKTKIGVFIGGNAKDIFITENQIRILTKQLISAANAINADILITTSRRTPSKVERLLFKEFKKHPRCPLLIIANKENVPEAVGGIIGLCDILVVSGDSISMVSEAASSGKKTIVFTPQSKEIVFGGTVKHYLFVEKLNAQGFILSADVKDISTSIFDLVKNKIQIRQLDDSKVILDAVRLVI